MGMPYMLTTNLWTQAGLTNGSRCVAHDIVCTDDPWSALPLAIIVCISDEYDAASDTWRNPTSDLLPCCLPALSQGKRCKYVPIPSIEREWSPDGNRHHTRRMFPLVCATAVTIHKAQGATLCKARVSVGDLERQLGLLFVAISRVRCLEDLALERPINADRLTRISNSKNLPLRQALDERLSGLEAQLDACIRHHCSLDDARDVWSVLSRWFRDLYRKMNME